MGQLLTEALLLSAGGGVAGILLASSTLSLLMTYLVGGDGPVYFLTATLEWRTLLFSLAVSMLTGLLFGLHPAWEAARNSVVSGLSDSGNASSSHGAARMRKLLVCAQVAISALLLVPTGLFLKSLINLLHVDLGLKTEKLGAHAG